MDYVGEMPCVQLPLVTAIRILRQLYLDITPKVKIHAYVGSFLNHFELFRSHTNTNREAIIYFIGKHV